MSTPVASSSTSRPTVFGLFDHTTPLYPDLEAQLITVPATPSPARVHTPRTHRTPSSSDSEETTDAVDDFFGAPRRPRRSPCTTLSGTRESRHDELRLSTPTDLDADVDVDVESLPPSYEHSLEPPAYTQVSDQPTLAMYLFKFGFLFPLFWLAGSLILLSPLRAPADWESTKPEVERAELIESMRRTEVKWARRCLVALGMFVLVVAAVVLAVLLAKRS